MRHNFENRYHFYYAGSIILIALLLGGGTSQRLWSDHLIQILLLPALFIGLNGLVKSKTNLPVKVLATCLMVFLAAQFLPFSRPLPALIELPSPVMSPLFSRDIGNSLEASLFAISVLGFFLYLTRLPKQMLGRLLSFLLVGVFANFAVMVVQLSFDSRVPIDSILPYKLTAGFFANHNHASTLVFTTIPIFAYLFIARQRRIGLYVVLVALEVAVLFAQGSRAGMAISAALGVICLVWFLLPERKPLSLTIQLGAVALVVMSIILLPFNPDWLGDDERASIFATTLQAASVYWPLGSGLGTFINIYPGFEPIENITAGYVNHAHNDYLELLLEGGAVAIFLIAAFLAIMLSHLFKSPINNAAGLAILAIGLHSAVDYSLRTFAIAIPFALFCALLFTPDPDSNERSHG